MAVVRRADLTDIPWLLVQLRDFDRWAHGKPELFPTDEREARAFLKTLIEDHCFLISQNDVRTGLIAGFLAPHFMNEKVKQLNEVFWWVLPAYRGTSVGARLLKAFVDYGCARDARIALTLEEQTIESGMIDPASLQRLGFQPRERTYLYDRKALASSRSA